MHAEAWPKPQTDAQIPDVKSSTSSTVWCGSSSYSNFKATSADTSFCSSEMNAKICSRPAHRHADRKLHGTVSIPRGAREE